RIGRWQERLRERGIETRNVVAVIANPSIDYVAAMRAIGRNMSAFFPLNPKLPIAALAQLIQTEETKLVLCSADLAAPLRDATGLSSESVVVLDSDDTIRLLPDPATGFE